MTSRYPWTITVLILIAAQIGARPVFRQSDYDNPIGTGVILLIAVVIPLACWERWRRAP